MTLPQRARIEATPNFLAGLEAARQFFVEQDVGTADARMAQLKTRLREMVAILAWSPGCGRPARFLSSRSAQSKLRSAAVRELARQAGLPELREYVVDQHIVLYAHSEREVMLLAIKHQKQLTYIPAA